LTETGYNRTLASTRLVATFALVVVLVALARPTPLEVGVGFTIAALGEAIRFWAAGHLLKTKELITSGPYRYTRNPLYLGRLLILTGLCVMCRLPWLANWVVLAAGYAVFFFYYLPRKERVEPARLRAVHGDAYDRYYRAVPALIPTLTPYAAGSNLGWSSDRMFRNREVWMIAGILAITLFLLWRSQEMPMRPGAATSVQRFVNA
jgi:protein-S-isoprenylcysteine O-methyltransferase Ste14